MKQSSLGLFSNIQLRQKKKNNNLCILGKERKKKLFYDLLNADHSKKYQLKVMNTNIYSFDENYDI